MKPTLLWFAFSLSSCATASGPTAHELAQLTAAKQALTQDPEATLRTTDALLQANPNWAEARLVAGEGALALARLGTSARADLLLADAVRDLTKGLAGEDEASPSQHPAAWQLLAETHYELGAWQLAAGAAARAASGFLGLTPRAEALAAQARLLGGKALYRAFLALRQPERENDEANRIGIVPPKKETLALANACVAAFEGVRAEFPGEACTHIALVYQWLDQKDAVVAEYERGIRTAPTNAATHEAYLEWMRNNGQREALAGAYARFIKENPKAAMLRWYQGRALYERADDLARDGNHQAAIDTYDKAAKSFSAYGEQVPNHQESVGQWLALCAISTARACVDLGKLDDAQNRLFAADTASVSATAVDASGKPQLLNSFGQHYAGVAFAIHRATAETAAEPLQATLSFNEALIARHPGRWGWVYNNAALAARDLGVQVAEKGEQGAALQLWEKSYSLYEKAMELSAQDARIVNDCGLMLIYHLHRDYEHATDLFRRAIGIGEAQLAAMPKDADERERELLEEAVGDAWQNLAVLSREVHKQPFSAYQEFCQQALRYYPYQRREAAAMLREAQQPQVPAPSAGQGDAKEAFAKARAAALAKAEEGDLDGALSALDGISKVCATHAPYHAYKGELSLELARQAVASGRKGAEFMFQDAIRALTRAVELDSEPSDVRLKLAKAQFEGSAIEAAVKTCSDLLLHLQSQGGGAADLVRETHLTRANAAARAYQQGFLSGGGATAWLDAARASFKALEKQKALTTPLLGMWSATEQWAKSPAEAVNIYVRALENNPDDQALIALVVDTAHAQGQTQLAVEALSKKTDATALWYLARARYLHGDALRQGGEMDQAIAMLDQAEAAFAASMEKNQEFSNSCEHWITMCHGKKGNIAFFAKNYAQAEKWLLGALKRHPESLAVPLGLEETIKLGLLRVADNFYKRGDLQHTESIYRQASDLCQGDLDLLNNSGLFARDYGNQLERDGKQKEAMGMYEQSYKAYSRALELDASNVRLRNDCALIAIYHLDRDWELSKQRLDGAIADGEKTLQDNPPKDRQELQNYEEAVGDCYENLALWHLKHSKDGAAAKAAAEASKRFHPGAKRPGANRHQKAAEALLQGK